MSKEPGNMGVSRSLISDGLYMTVEQYLVLDESSDAKRAFPNSKK